MRGLFLRLVEGAVPQIKKEKGSPMELKEPSVQGAATLPLSGKAEPLASLGELEGHSSGMFAVFALWYDSEEKKK